MKHLAMVLTAVFLTACQTTTTDDPNIRNLAITSLESRVSSLETSQRSNNDRLDSAERRISGSERKVDEIDRTIAGYSTRIQRLEKHAKRLDLGELKDGCRVIFRGDPNSPEPPSLEHLCSKAKS
jgi:uncharacterized protein YlxW (UPF0749 family)